MRYKGIHPNDINEVSQSVVSIYAGGEEKLTLSGSSANFSTSVSASQFSGSFIGDGSQLTGLGADSPFTLTGSYYSTNSDLKVTGSFDVDGIIKERARVLIPTILEDLVLDENARNVFHGDVMTDENGEAIIFDGDGGDNLFPLTGSSITVGSANVDGTVTANAFVGDGSQLTNISTAALPDGVVSSSTQTVENLLNQNVNLGTGVLTASAANLSGDISIGGNIYLGDSIATDSIEVQATLSGSLIPSDNEAFDIGSPTKRYRDIYLSGSSVFLDNTKLSLNSVGDLRITDNNDNLRAVETSQISVASGSDIVNISVSNGKLSFTDENDEVVSTGAAIDVEFNELQNTPFTYDTGSTELEATASVFSFKSTGGSINFKNNSGESMFSVTDGVVKLQTKSDTPSAEAGALFYSSSNELYLAV